MLKKIAHFLKVFTLCFFTFVAVYVAVFYGLSFVPSTAVSEKRQVTEDEVTIYLSTNGVHTDFVMPVVHEVIDWRTKVEQPLNGAKWLAFGWGDKGFYIDTPSWSDLRMTTALSALSGVGESAMHVTAYGAFALDENTVEVKLSTTEYQALVHYIDASFDKKEGAYQRIEVEGYHQSDAFYEARGSYSLFYTCNTWVNQGLKQINQKAALWTLHDQGILRHYK